MAFIGPACIEARMNNGVEAQRLGLGNGLDAGVGGGGGRDVNLPAGHADPSAKEPWKTEQR